MNRKIVSSFRLGGAVHPNSQTVRWRLGFWMLNLK